MVTISIAADLFLTWLYETFDCAWGNSLDEIWDQLDRGTISIEEAQDQTFGIFSAIRAECEDE